MDSDDEHDDRVDLLVKADLEGYEQHNATERDVVGCLKTRQWMAMLMCFGFFNVYAMRINLSEAVDPMSKHYKWNDAQEGYVLSSFFWGYVCGQVPGGLLADKYVSKMRLYIALFSQRF
jgi:sugar phosphate permease